MLREINNSYEANFDYSIFYDIANLLEFFLKKENKYAEQEKVIIDILRYDSQKINYKSSDLVKVLLEKI